jgi:hypothetical protein
MIFFFYNEFIFKENILVLFCDIMSSFVTSLLLNKFLLFNIYRMEIDYYSICTHGVQILGLKINNFGAI